MIRTIKEADLCNKKVIMRVDFNVPVDSESRVINDSRIKAALPTIRLVLKNAPQLILMSHLGKPDGKVVAGLRMDNVAKRLSRLLKQKVAKVDDCVDVNMPDEKIIMLENLRFHDEEEKNDSIFAKKLASYADVYVNDAFGTCHRKHASVHAITKFLPSYAGLLLDKEIKMLNQVKHPKHPFIAVLGGAKVEDKIKLINQLTKKADKILIGGAMMFAFYKANGLEVGKSLCKGVDVARKLNSKKIILPEYVVVAEKKADKYVNVKTVKKDEVKPQQIGLDVGKGSIEEFAKYIKKAKTVFWNGPLGMYEKKPFDKGTLLLAKMLAKSKAQIVIGGGDVVSAVEKLRLSRKNIHLSTGGGASLEFIEGELPGIKALE